MTERSEPPAGRGGRTRRSDPESGQARDRARLPDVSTDDTDIGWGDLPYEPGSDDGRILREVPPHHMG